jgi:hypothetical protein
MQAFLREKNSDVKGATKKEPEVTAKSLDESIGRFKLASWSRKSSKKPSSAAKEEEDGSKNGTNAFTKNPMNVARMPSPV